MSHYEYLFLTKSLDDRWSAEADTEIPTLDDPMDLLASMNQLGDEGWEAFNMLMERKKIYQVSMRRVEAG